MAIRLSEVGEYSTRVVTRVSPQQVSVDARAPEHAAQEALRRYGNGLALTETRVAREDRARLGGLGELVQVVT